MTKSGWDRKSWVSLSEIAPGNVQVHWPEGKCLIGRGIADPECGIPDFNTDVEIVRLS